MERLFRFSWDLVLFSSEMGLVGFILNIVWVVCRIVFVLLVRVLVICTKKKNVHFIVPFIEVHCNKALTIGRLLFDPDLINIVISGVLTALAIPN